MIKEQDQKAFIKVPKPKGRPTKLNNELIERIAQHIEDGNFIETACQLESINKDTYYEWFKKGRDVTNADTLYKKFYDRIYEAEATQEDRLIKLHDKFLAESHKAVEWRMERRNKDKWSKKETIEHQGNPLSSLIDVIMKSKKAVKDDDK